MKKLFGVKRPLFAVCVGLTCAIALYYFLNPPLLPDKVPAGAEEILLYGRVDRKESRNSYGKEQFILYLTDVSASYQEQDIENILTIRQTPNQASNQVSNQVSNQTFNQTSNQTSKQISNPVTNQTPNQTFNQFSKRTITYSGQVLCYTASNTWEPKAGSFVLVRGKPEDFKRATNPGQFDSRLYYATLGIDFCVKNGEVLGESENYSKLREGLWKLRTYCCNRLEQTLGEREASVMKTMLLGDKTSLDKDIKNLYQDGGISHILAISGMHISMIGMGNYRLLRKAGVPIWIAAVIGGVCIVFYGMMTGAGASGGRAVGMFLIRMLAEILGRGYDTLTALGVLLFLMVYGQPLYLYHSGFLLSFSAIFAICLLCPALEKDAKERAHEHRPGKYREGPAKRIYGLWQGVQKSFRTSASVTLVTLPITFWYFYEVPIYGVLLNLFVLPLVPVVMYLGVGLLMLPEGIWLQLLAVPLNLFLRAIEYLCRGSLQFPGDTFIRGRPQVWQIGLYVGLLALAALGGRGLIPIVRKISGMCKRKGTCKRKKAVVLSFDKKFPWAKRIQGIFRYRWRMLVILFAVFILCARLGSGLEITFLDVGQGDSIVVQSADGGAYLIDCGSSGGGYSGGGYSGGYSNGSVGKYVVAPYLKCRGIAYLDAVIITHPDEDHCNGLKSLLEEGYGERIGRVLLPAVAGAEEWGGRLENMEEVSAEALCVQYGVDEAYAELIQLAGAYDIPVGFLSAGMQWQEGDVQFTCLHPAGENETAENGDSIVLHIRQGAFSALFTGDVEGAGETHLAQMLRMYGIEEVTVLKVAHHGSRYSTKDAFLQVLDARLAVISCGADNRYGHPHEELLERLAEDGMVVLTTPEYGAISVWTDGKRVKVRGGR